MLNGRMRKQRFTASMGSTGSLGSASLMSSLLLLLTFSSFNVSARILATVDRTTASEFDLITLTLRSEKSSVRGRPDFSPLETDFQIVDSSRSSRQSISIVNGRQSVESYTDWTVALRPKREGRLVIPSIRIGNEESNPVYVSVVPPTAAAQKRSKELLFFETEVDSNSVYVQAQIVYTVRLFYSDTISGNISEKPQIDDAIVEIIESEKRYQSIANNRRYNVLEKKYAIFPQKSGALTIPRETFVGYKGASGFFTFSTREKVNAVSKILKIKVQPKPASYPSANWLPATDISVDESWSVTPPVFRVGEPINRIITISANGLPASILPAIAPMDQTLVKVYRDPAETSETASTDGIISLRAEVMGVVPTLPGELVLPEIRIPWWNTRKDQLEQAVIAAKTFQIQPALQTTPTASLDELDQAAIVTGTNNDTGSVTVSESASGFWFYVTLALALVSAFLLYQLYSMRKKLQSIAPPNGDDFLSPATPNISEAALYKKFVGACHKNNPAAIQQHLFLWVKQIQPETQNLSQFSRQQKDKELNLQLKKLEQHLYGMDSKVSFNANSLLESIANIRQRILSKEKTTKELLAPLNP